MKNIQSALVLAVLSAALVGCASTDTKPTAAAAPAPTPAAAPVAPAASADAGLQKAVEASLTKEAQLKGSKIAVAATTDGAVALSGTVKNDWQQYLAGETAKKTKGVKSVKNSIKVPD